MPETKILNVGGVHLPVDIEALETLPVTAGGSTRFDFSFKEIGFSACFEQGDGVDSLVLSGDCGPLPYTAESPPARAGLGQIVVDANSVLGETFCFSRGRIQFKARTTVELPLTATHAVAAVATLLVPAIPYLELIAVYIRPPLALGRPGESAIQPQWRRGGAGNA